MSPKNGWLSTELLAGKCVWLSMVGNVFHFNKAKISVMIEAVHAELMYAGQFNHLRQVYILLTASLNQNLILYRIDKYSPRRHISAMRSCIMFLDLIAIVYFDLFEEYYPNSI